MRVSDAALCPYMHTVERVYEGIHGGFLELKQAIYRVDFENYHTRFQLSRLTETGQSISTGTMECR